MKFFVTTAFIFLSSIVFSQTKKDSSQIYIDKMNDITTEAMAKAQATDEYKKLQAASYLYNRRKNNYTGQSIFGMYNKANLNTFNNSVNTNGFSSMKNAFAGIGFSINVKRGKTLIDFNYLSLMLNNTAKKTSTNQVIYLSSIDFLQTQIGYALVDNNWITIYPYAGLGLRASSMNFENTQVINNAGTNISNYVLTPHRVDAWSFKFTYQAGLGMDIKLTENEKKQKATFLFVKGGINRSIGPERFRIDDFKFNPNITLNQWQIIVGLKWAMR